MHFSEILKEKFGYSEPIPFDLTPENLDKINELLLGIVQTLYEKYLEIKERNKPRAR